MPGLYYALGKKNPYFVSETVVCNRLPATPARGDRAGQAEIALLKYEMVRHLGYDEKNVVDGYFRDRYVACPPPTMKASSFGRSTRAGAPEEAGFLYTVGLRAA